jgi:hypothetical protein
MKTGNLDIQKPKTPSEMRQRLRGGAVVLAAGISALAGSGSLSGPTVVSAGSDLQAALDRARPGDVLMLEPGAVFVGNFVLPAKEGDEAITIRSAARDRDLPEAGARIGPEHESLLPTIESPNSAPALRTRAGARHWRILAIQFRAAGGNDIVALGDGSRAQADYAGIPEDIVLDRVLIRGDPVRGQKRGIALNSGATVIQNSHIDRIMLAGQETQAIAGWNGPGPYVIENNRLEAAGVNVLFGGAETFIGHLVTADIVVRRNHLTKDPAWREARWTVKNHFELKSARRVLIDGNVLEHNWSAAQVGFSVLFTVRNPGGAPWAAIEDVTFQNNVVRHVAAGINILGHDTNAASQHARGIVIRNNLFANVDHHAWGGNGAFLQIGEEAADVRVEHNTIHQTGSAVIAYGGTRAAPRRMPGFRFVGNIALHNEFGVIGSGFAPGTATIASYFPDGVISDNVLAGGAPARYPPGNHFPSVDDLMVQFVEAEAGDFRLRPSSWLRQAGPEGRPLGVDYRELVAALGGTGAR